MLPSSQNYKEYIQEQGQIEKDIAQGWGYQINSNQYIPRRQKVTTNLKVACIEPLRQIFDLPISKKLQKVEEELLMLQNERKLNELTEKAFDAKAKGEALTEQECAAIRMMHQCVQEYNFIINHRHIVEKNSQRARKILGIQKSQSKELFEKIHSLKQQLGKSTLTNTIKINSEIAKLYKKYSRLVPKSLNNSERLPSQNKSIINRALTSINNSTNSFIGTSKLSPNKNSLNIKESEVKLSQNKDSKTKQESLIEIKDLMIMQEINESQEGDSLAASRLIEEQLRMQPQSMLIHHGFAKLQRRISEYAPRKRIVTLMDAKQKQKQEKKSRMVTTIEEAYEKKEIIHKGKKLDKALQDHQDVIDIWKQRINENKEKNQTYYLKFQTKTNSKKFRSLKNTKRNVQVESEQKNKASDHVVLKKIDYKAEQIKQNLEQKEKIIAQILRKKQSKYKRIPGTQILQKNDVKQTAKIFLGTAKHQESHEDHSKHKKTINQEELAKPQWQILEQNDEKLYWSMCKNEKMNILLKSRKEE